MEKELASRVKPGFSTRAIEPDGSDFVEPYEVDFDHATQLEQALIGTFIFGMIHAHGISQGLTPPQVHALALTVFKDILHYTDEAAAQGVQECINAPNQIITIR